MQLPLTRKSQGTFKRCLVGTYPESSQQSHQFVQQGVKKEGSKGASIETVGR